MNLPLIKIVEKWRNYVKFKNDFLTIFNKQKIRIYTIYMG